MFPTFVTHLPKELVPLAKLSPDDPTTVEVFECCINGQEISPGYTEQNDPIQQRTTLEHQAGGDCMAGVRPSSGAATQQVRQPWNFSSAPRPFTLLRPGRAHSGGGRHRHRH